MIKELVKKIPFSVGVYRFFRDLPFIFYPKTQTIQGSIMYLDPWEEDKDLRRTFRAYAKQRIHEPITTQLIRSILHEGDTFLDLGANIGYFSMLASRIVGSAGRVYSFEPEPRNFKFLLLNKQLNKYDQMTAMNMAVSNQPGRIKLFICPYDTGHHTIHQSEGITSYATSAEYDRSRISFVEIDAMPLDAFLASRQVARVDLIKMDVEGAELLALQGMKETMAKNDDVKMIVEYFPLLVEKMGCSPGELLKLIAEDFGFLLFEISEDYCAEHGQIIPLLKRIPDPAYLLVKYSRQKMYHSNLFAIKERNKDLSKFVHFGT
jgi:FkbM family methyltransferase